MLDKSVCVLHVPPTKGGLTHARPIPCPLVRILTQDTGGWTPLCSSAVEGTVPYVVSQAALLPDLSEA